MIYTKKANFPYPVLMNFTNEYKDALFELDVDLRDKSEEFFFDITWKISSKFIKKKLEDGSASIVLIIKSKDNQFHILDYNKNPSLVIPKRKLSINNRVVLQLLIKCNSLINFSMNTDLDDFYQDIRNNIQIYPGMVLGFSNTVIFDGSQKKPYDLFEKKIDTSIKSDVEIRLGEETIIIVCKNEKFQFSDIPNSPQLNYPYLYMGLQKALMMFLIHANSEYPEDGVRLCEMEPPENALESKLYTLMISKNVSELTLSNIDEVINNISQHLIERYVESVKGLQGEN